MFKKHIAFKLMAGFAVIVLISMLAIGIFFIEMFRQYTFQNTENTLLSRAHSIAEMMSDFSETGGPMRGYGGFMMFLNTMSEANVWITDNHGNPALVPGMGMPAGGQGPEHPVNSEPLPDIAQQVIKQVLSGKESVSQSYSSMYDEVTLTVGVPILNQDNQVSGAVLLLAPVTGISATVNKAINILVISLLAALLPALGLGIYYSIQFTRPLQAMNRTAQEMAQGNYTVRTGVDSQDELGQLGTSLDQLASELGYTINQLFQEKGKLADIITSISEGIVAFDLNLKPLSVNSALSEIMQRPNPYPETILENDFANLGIDLELKKVIHDKKTIQLSCGWKDKILKFTLSPIIDNSGNINGSVALVQDISESERLEQLRKDFVANVSHEFRTPLTVIKGSLEAIVDGTINHPDQIQRYHMRMLIETRSLERLVIDLLDLSKLQSGRLSINQEPVHIPSLLLDTIKSLQSIADKKQIIIDYKPLADVSPVTGDYDRIRQLFIIFLDNAIKYSPENTVITIENTITQTFNVMISDQGYGIAEDQIPYIWDRFYKADISRQHSGTGLGLAIAKHLIDLHHGQVALQSEPGKGTAITVSFPYKSIDLL